MMKINEFEIRHKALDARKKLKIENYGPIDIEKIIEDCMENIEHIVIGENNE